jgi:hypothetical protein
MRIDGDSAAENRSSVARPSPGATTAEVLDEGVPHLRPMQVSGGVAAAIVAVHGDIAVRVLLPVPP